MKDRFSKHSKLYSQFRPTYPEMLYQFLFSQVHKFDSAWDCGTGNGQAAGVLATRFRKVIATDISAKQLENAARAENIFYSVGGEETSLPDDSVDLITVAQAIHWFDIEKFYREVNRVARPNAVLAVWGYSLLRINEAIDSHLKYFYKEIVGPYWDKERKLIDEEYKSIPFPFTEIDAPSFEFSVEWTIEQLEGYLTTWSAVQKYINKNGENPVDLVIDKIRPHWRKERSTIKFPLFLRVGRC